MMRSKAFWVTYLVFAVALIRQWYLGVTTGTPAGSLQMSLRIMEYLLPPELKGSIVAAYGGALFFSLIWQFVFLLGLFWLARGVRRIFTKGDRTRAG